MPTNNKVKMSGVDPLPFVISGIIGTVVFVIVWIVAAYLTDLWVTGVQTFSELGISKDKTAAMVFNYGCMVCGAMCTCLGVGKIMCEKNKWSRLSGFCLIVSDVMLLMSGMFDLSFGDIHRYIVYTFMTFFALAVIFSIPGDWFFVTKMNSYISALLLIITGFALFTQSFAMFEVVAVVCLLSWKGLQCIKLMIIRRRFIEMEERKNTVASYYHSEL